MTTYSKYKTSKYWKLIESELKALEENQDLSITTDQEYVVGSLVKKIVESDSTYKTTPTADRK